MHSVTIDWGTDKEVRTTKKFNTQAELDAYMEGIDDMIGWYRYEVVEED
jgi:hypothetical protein